MKVKILPFFSGRYFIYFWYLVLSVRVFFVDMDNETHWVMSVMLCHTLFCWTSVMVAVISCLWQMSMQGNLPG